MLFSINACRIDAAISAAPTGAPCPAQAELARLLRRRNGPGCCAGVGEDVFTTLQYFEMGEQDFQRSRPVKHD